MAVEKIARAVKNLFSGEGRIRLIVVLGLIGMALILLSQFFSGGGGDEEVDTATAQFTAEQYAADLEEKLSVLVGGMAGVGEARVMVTLESGVEYIYAREEKRNTDTTREGVATPVEGKVYEKENVEQTYILVENQNGRKQPLELTQLQPKVQGVVIVCEGADNIRVQQSLINVVTTALNIPSTRVCVVKIDNNFLQEEA